MNSTTWTHSRCCATISPACMCATTLHVRDLTIFFGLFVRVRVLLSEAHISTTLSLFFALAFAFAMDHWSNIDTCIEILLGNLSFNTPRPVYQASIEILQEIVKEARSIQTLPTLEALDTSHCRWRDAYEAGPKQSEGSFRNEILSEPSFVAATSTFVFLLTHILFLMWFCS